MWAIAIESSHKRGMGHFFRAVNIYNALKERNEDCLILINDDKVSVDMLKKQKIPFEVIDYEDTAGNRAGSLIDKYNIGVWLLDKFATSLSFAKSIKERRVFLAAIDDCGEGAELTDVNFCAMLFEGQRGKKIFAGKDYLALNPEIAKYRRRRRSLNKILVTLGGSDTYGVTVKIAKILAKKGIAADFAIGPEFRHKKELLEIAGKDANIFQNVPSLIAFMSNYDFAITGGGVTCFEANASGIPGIIIANELHEIPIAKYVSSFGGSVFAGYHEEIDETVFDLSNLPIAKMSEKALEAFHLNGIDNIISKIKTLKGIS